MSDQELKKENTEVAKSEEYEFPEPSYKQTLKAVGSFIFLFSVQVPLAMRQIFKIRRNKATMGHLEKYWFLFVALNLPVTLYFARYARIEIKINRKLE